MVILLLALIGQAAPSGVAWQDGPLVRGAVDVAAPAGTVRALLRDPEALARVVDTDVRMVPEPGPGPCRRTAVEVASPIGVQHAVVQACDTPLGTAVHLIHSEDFRAYAYTWEVRELADGTARVSYSLKVSPRMWIPAALVRRVTLGKVRSVLEQLAAFRARDQDPW